MHAWEARKAYRDYQAAAASGNPTWTRLALMRLVNLDEDVPDYWIELGKLDLQLGDYRKAFDDFSRAHELDLVAQDAGRFIGQARAARRCDSCSRHSVGRCSGFIPGRIFDRWKV